METTLNIVSIIIIVFGILQIILFFKIWGMTNDISEIKVMVKDYIKNRIVNLYVIKINQKVILK